MNRQQAIQKAVIFRRGDVTIQSDENGVLQEEHKTINAAKRVTRGYACVALRKGELVPDRKKEAAA